MKKLSLILALGMVLPALGEEKFDWDNIHHNVIFSDINGDSVPDIVFQPKTDDVEPYYVLGSTNTDSPRYSPSNKHPLPQELEDTEWDIDSAIVLTGKINNDSSDDLLLIVPEEEKFFWLKGDSNSPLKSSQQIQIKKQPWDMEDDEFEYYSGDFNGNGTMDLLALSVEKGKHLLYHNDGTGQFTLAQKISSKAKWGLQKQERLIISDFNNDGKDDILSLAKNAEQNHYVVYADKNGKLKNKNVEELDAKFAGVDWFDNSYSTSTESTHNSSENKLLRMYNIPGGYDELDNYIAGNEEEEALKNEACRTAYYIPNTKENGFVCHSEQPSSLKQKSTLSEQSLKAPSITTSFEPSEPGTSLPAPPTSAPSSSVGAYPAVNQSFTLSWSAYSGDFRNEVHYELWESTNKVNYSRIYKGSSTSISIRRSSAGYRYFKIRYCGIAGCGGYGPYRTVLIYNKPTAPTGLKLASSSFEIGNSTTLSWTRPSGIIWTGGYYNVNERRPNGSVTKIKTVSNGSTTSTSVKPNSGAGTYSYQLQGCNKTSSYCGPWSSWTSTTVLPPIPSSPSASVGSKALTGQSYSVSFNSAYATSYKIYENNSLVSTTSSTSRSFSKSSPGIYSYRIAACNSRGCSSLGASDSIQVNDRPTISPTSPANNASFLSTQSVLARATASDSYGGISNIQYRLNSGSWTTNGAFGQLPAGNHTIYYRSLDAHGVYSSTVSRNISVSTPTAKILNLSYPSVSVGYKQTFSFSYQNATLCQASTGPIYYQGAMKSGTYTWTSPVRTAATNYSFTLTCSNSISNDSTTVSVSVAANSTPTVSNDSLFTSEDSSERSVSVLTNDTDPDGHSLTVTAVGNAAKGSTRFDSGKVYYKPNLNSNGSDSFTYTVSDGWGGTKSANVIVNVSAVNDAPTAGDFSLNFSRNSGPVSVNVTRSPSRDVDSSMRIHSITSHPSNGTASFSTSSITYTPNPNWCGNDVINYRLTDGALTSNNATISVRGNCANRVPTGGVTITGDSLVGAGLAYSHNIADLDGLGTISAQWNRNAAPIPGATGNVYTTTIDDIGSVISVTLSYTDGGGVSESVTQAMNSAISSPSDTITISAIELVPSSVEVGQEQQITFSITNAEKCYDSDAPEHIFYQGAKTNQTIIASTLTRYTPNTQAVQKITCESSLATSHSEQLYNVIKLQSPTGLNTQN